MDSYATIYITTVRGDQKPTGKEREHFIFPVVL
jgi:hypothetical protein